jgi:hypothetical protein
MVEPLRLAPSSSEISLRSLRKAAGRSIAIGIAGLFVIFVVALAVYPWRAPAYFWDFRAFYRGAAAYLHGHSPYPMASLAALTNKQNFVYPLPVAGLFAPFALLPFGVAAGLFAALNVAALALTLRALNVTDPRCYVVALIGLPSQYALKLGTIMPILALLLALAWRYRDRTRVAVPVLALLVLAKVFLWPIGVWYLATRRVGAVVGASLVALGLLGLSVVPVGLEPIRAYPHLLSVLSNYESTFSWSVTTFGVSLGMAPHLAAFLQYLVGGGVLLGAVLLARRGDLRGSFALAVGASLALSPIVWGHYFVLCLVPLALQQRRFSAVWLATAWVVPDTTAFGASRPYFIAAAAAACALQLGVGRRLRLPLLPSVAVACVVAAALIVSAGFIARSATPRWVALRGEGAASGAADVRLGDRRVCWTVWAENVPSAGLRLAFLAPGSRAVLAMLAPRLTLHDGRAEGCAADRRTRAWRAQSKAGRFAARLAVVGSSGSVLLAGTLEDLVNARPGPLG